MVQCDHLQTGGTLHRCIICRQQLVKMHDTAGGFLFSFHVVGSRDCHPGQKQQACVANRPVFDSKPDTPDTIVRCLLIPQMQTSRARPTFEPDVLENRRTDVNEEKRMAVVATADVKYASRTEEVQLCL